MAMESQLRAIEVDVDESFEPLALEECLRLMPLRAEVCRQRRTFFAVQEACDICRSSWAAYLLQWTEDPQICHRNDIEAGFQDCLSAVASAAETFGGTQRELAENYADNIRFRLHLVVVLHTKGSMAAKHEMRRHQQELTRRI